MNRQLSSRRFWLDCKHVPPPRLHQVCRCLSFTGPLVVVLQDHTGWSLPKILMGQTQKMPSAWLAHVRAYRAKHKGVSLKDALKAASKTYKKSAAAAPKKKRRRKKPKKY